MKFALNAYYWPKRSLIFLYIAKIWCVSRFGGLFTQHICKVYKRRVLTWMTVIVNVTDTAWKVSQIRSFFWSVFSCIRTEYWDLQSKYRPEKTPYLDTFQAGNSHTFTQQRQMQPLHRNQGIDLSIISTLYIIFTFHYLLLHLCQHCVKL